MSNSDERDPDQAVPMFPLGSVVVPGAVTPLHIFEPRYRELAKVVTTGSNQFGVALIERGSEVGGSDVRVDVGCLTRVIQSEEFPDGRWALVAVGVHRIKITTWLPDDPYPQALVEPWPDEPEPGDTEGAYQRAITELRRTWTLAANLRSDPNPLPDLSDLADEPTLGSFQLAAISPVGPLDRQRLLCAPGTLSRLELCRTLLHEQGELYHGQIVLDAEDDFDPPPSG